MLVQLAKFESELLLLPLFQQLFEIRLRAKWPQVELQHVCVPEREREPRPNSTRMALNESAHLSDVV